MDNASLLYEDITKYEDIQSFIGRIEDVYLRPKANK
jgi:hypothetical protein